MTSLPVSTPAAPALSPSLRDLAPWLVLVAALALTVLYLVGLAPSPVLHEFMHDGRHLLSFPCH